MERLAHQPDRRRGPSADARASGCAPAPGWRGWESCASPPRRAQHSSHVVERHDQQLRLSRRRRRAAGRAAWGRRNTPCVPNRRTTSTWPGSRSSAVKLDAVHAQHAADDLAEAAEAGDDHRRVVGVDRVVVRAAAWASAAGAPASRRPRTGSASPTIDAAITSVAHVGLGGAQRAGGDGGAEQHEAELAGLRQARGAKRSAFGVFCAGDARQRERDRRLGEQQHRRRRGEQHRLRAARAADRRTCRPR